MELFLPERMWDETKVEVPRRVRAFARRRALESTVADRLTASCIEAVEANVVVLEEAVYSAIEEEARSRSLRDPDDWPVVASALALRAGIWTNDNDFLGTGVPTWTTETLSSWLARHQEP